eukprot:GILK01008604.1.p1 GENE.GILK01008604.1~~GILK01008604.1.p1  ORF type:complete len:312 (+),score=29.70 GILK01008604.1:32-937(+)
MSEEKERHGSGDYAAELYALRKRIMEFAKSDAHQLAFPNTLTSRLRRYIHEWADELHLDHFSCGVGPERFIIVSHKKREKRKDSDHSEAGLIGRCSKKKNAALLFALPDEVWKTSILHCLGILDLIRLSEVCHQFGNLQADEEIWMKATIQQFPRVLISVQESKDFLSWRHYAIDRFVEQLERRKHNQARRSSASTKREKEAQKEREKDKERERNSKKIGRFKQKGGQLHCRVCGNNFDPTHTTSVSCFYHPGHFKHDTRCRCHCHRLHSSSTVRLSNLVYIVIFVDIVCLVVISYDPNLI